MVFFSYIQQFITIRRPRGAEKLFAELLVRLVTKAREGLIEDIGLERTHPLIRFALEPDNIEVALLLDDTVIWGALSSMADAEDTLIQEFARRLRDRKLFKCVDIRARVSHEFDPETKGFEDSNQAIESCCASIRRNVESFVQSEVREVPRILLDEASRSPYKDVSGSKGLTERINVRTDGGSLVDLKQRSRVVANIPEFRLLRAYFDESDSLARDRLAEIIRTEVEAFR